MAQAALATIGHNNPPSLLETLAEEHCQLRHTVETLADKANHAPKEIADETDYAVLADLVKQSSVVLRDVDRARVTAKEPYLQAGRDVDTFFASLGDRLKRMKDVMTKRADDYVRRKRDEERRAREEEARKLREEEARQREIAARAAEANRPTAAAKAEDKAETFAARADQTESANVSAADLTRVRTAGGATASARTEWTFEITDWNAIPLDMLRPYMARPEVEKAIRSLIRIQKNAVTIPGVRIFEDVKASIR